jgi:hypothetical protein
MQVEFHIRGLEADGEVRQQLVAGLWALNDQMAIAHAAVVLEQQCGSTLPCQVLVVLAVAGADIRAAARDCTWEAAQFKVIARLREKMQEHLETNRMP